MKTRAIKQLSLTVASQFLHGLVFSQNNGSQGVDTTLLANLNAAFQPWVWLAGLLVFVLLLVVLLRKNKG